MRLGRWVKEAAEIWVMGGLGVVAVPLVLMVRFVMMIDVTGLVG